MLQAFDLRQKIIEDNRNIGPLETGCRKHIDHFALRRYRISDQLPYGILEFFLGLSIACRRVSLGNAIEPIRRR